MKRRYLWSAVAVVLAMLALLVAFESGLLPWPWASGMKAKADAIRVGMTEGDVDAVLGRPPEIKAPLDGQGSALAVCYSPEGNVAVDYDAEGRMVLVRFVQRPRQRCSGTVKRCATQAPRPQGVW